MLLDPVGPRYTDGQPLGHDAAVNEQPQTTRVTLSADITCRVIPITNAQYEKLRPRARLAGECAKADDNHPAVYVSNAWTP